LFKVRELTSTGPVVCESNLTQFLDPIVFANIEFITYLFFQLLTVGSNASYQQSWIESHKSQLVELGEYIQMETKQLITKEVISDIQNTSSEPGKASIEYAH